MDLLQLRYFYDSANYMSISKTAEKYKVPPTSVSASIRRLEKELGCELFERYPNRIVLNDKGKSMRDSLKRIFAEMDYMLQTVSGTTDDNKEIKILVRAVRSLVTEQIIQYKCIYSHTRFELVASFDETNLENYDVIVDTQSDLYAGYESLKLCNQRILLYTKANNNQYLKKLCLQQLSREPFVLMSRQGNHGKIFSNACKKAGFTPNIVAQVNDSSCFRKIISSGIAIGIIGELAVENEKSEPLEPLDVTDFNYEQPVCMYYKKEKCYGNVAKFITFVRENIKHGTGDS